MTWRVPPYDRALAEALATVEALARRVLGVDTFFEWTSESEPVDLPPAL